MSGIKKPVLEYGGGEGRLTQEIDLEALTGIDLSNNDSVKRAIGQEIIDYIVNRTESGIDARGNAFKGYSKSYKESLNFQAAGKSNVNLHLSGDMLAAIDIVDEGSNDITIGIVGGDESARAYGHQTGFKGHPTIKGPKREFFGITESEFNKKILPKFKKELSQIKDEISDVQGKLINKIRNAKDL